MGTTTHLTIDDFENLPAAQAEGHELVDGELVDVSGNTPEHIEIRDLLTELLRPFVRKHRIGRVYSELEYDFDGNAHGPDVSFIRADQVPLIQRNKRVQRFVPDLAVEVVSANDSYKSLSRKKARYRRCGTKEVWIVDPEDQEVHIYSETGDRILRGDAELSTPLLPGFRIQVKDLFETE